MIRDAGAAINCIAAPHFRFLRLVTSPMHRLIPLALFALAGCHKADNEPGPGGVTVGEAKALDAAAEQSDAQTRALLANQPHPTLESEPARPAR